ncbi:hypothetical protein [Chengkuizengella axinellae]|uniref:Uncharacterized protein n=1 Tax=Chengkuizengella axinellae TaxID=3064388 RepID=A0ABT9J0T9_9BACL|nr:hypothetical protein [Chengkuizengella sp. 2205SS18-9]MDP5275239.1 hypothetical protein [Chengkuizengella sp. 2205SS18-9]
MKVKKSYIRLGIGMLTMILFIVGILPLFASGPFDIHLTTNYSDWYEIEPPLSFKEQTGGIVYAITIEDVKAKMQITSEGSKVMLNYQDIFKNDPIINDAWDATVSYITPNTRQASQLQNDMFSSWTWWVRNASNIYVDPEDYVFFEELKQFVGQIKEPELFYWQGVTYIADGMVIGAFEGKKATIQVDQYLQDGTEDSYGIFKVDLRLVVKAQYDMLGFVHTTKTYWFNHFTEVSLKQFAFSATNTALSGGPRNSADVVGDLEVLDRDDTLNVTLLSTFNAASPTDNYNEDQWIKDRKNPKAHGPMNVPTYLYSIYINYDPTTDEFSLHNEALVETSTIWSTQLSSESPRVSTKINPDYGDYVLIIPILNVFRFYEDIGNPDNKSKVGAVNWSDVTNKLETKFKEVLSGGDSENRGFRKIVNDINIKYEKNLDDIAISDNLANQAFDQIMEKMKIGYESIDLSQYHDIPYISDNRVQSLMHDRLLPATPEGRAEIISFAKNADLANGNQIELDQQMKRLYEKHYEVQDIVDAWFSDSQELMTRNILAVPFKVKESDDLEIVITDTGITPKVANQNEAIGMEEYENQAQFNKEPSQSSYGIPGKQYTATLTLTNNSDFPVTNMVLRNYVVSSQPGGGNAPIIYNSTDEQNMGMFFGKQYAFEDNNGIKMVPTYPANAQVDPSLVNVKQFNTTGKNAGFLDAGETFETTFQWRMPTETQNPDKDPIYLYVTVGEEIDQHSAMIQSGGSGNVNWEPAFKNTLLQYTVDGTPATLISFTPSEIKPRNESPEITDRDDHTVAIQLDVADPNSDPDIIPKQDLRDEMDFLRFAEITTETEREVEEWVEDGYWANLGSGTVNYKRTQWIVD